MSVIITIVDEMLPGKLVSQFPVTVPSNRVTVRDIITARVAQEVENYNATGPEIFHGLIQPSESEGALNGFRLKPHKQINCQVQVEAALTAFERNGFLVLVNKQQVDSLDEDVDVTSDTKISFVKLVPLVGG